LPIKSYSKLNINKNKVKHNPGEDSWDEMSDNGSDGEGKEQKLQLISENK